MKNKDLKFAFFGTPDVASETLEILKASGYFPTLIITAPDRPAGRKMILTPPPVKTWAIKNNIPYLQPEKPTEKEICDVLRTLGRSVVRDADPGQKMVENYRGGQNITDFFLVVAYGKILPAEIIDAPRLGSINIHYSLLPKYRGASPVESAILNGDTETGVTIQQMEFKMDSGPILAQEIVQISPIETAPELKKRLIKIGGELLVKILPNLIDGEIISSPQDDSQATYCKKMTKEDGLIDLDANGTENYNKFRAYAHWPRTYFFRDNKRHIITSAELVDGKFVIKKVIPEGGKEQAFIY